MIIGGIIVGQGYIDNVLLVPGNNTVPIRATLDMKTVIMNLPAILTAEGDALKSGNVAISASGNSTTYNGQHIVYYEQVLNNLVVTGQVPIFQILTDTLQEFLGSSTGSLLTGLLGSLNGTSILGNITSILGNGGSYGRTNSTSLLSGLANLGGRSSGGIGKLTGLLSGLTNLKTRDNLWSELTKAKSSESLLSGFTKLDSLLL